jgi:4,5-dihydroxyphthalate decarboxylase
VVRTQRFAVAELPIITYLIARDHGFPFYLVPVVLLARYPFQHLVQEASQAPLRPEELAGKRVAIRSYSVTTVTHVRDVLLHNYNVRSSDIDWISTEAPHVESYKEPSFVRSASAGETPASLLKSGIAEAAVLGGKTVDSAYRSVFVNPSNLIAAWQARAGGSAPMNHLIAIKSETVGHLPNVAIDVFEAFKEANAAAVSADPSLAQFHPVGFRACRAGLEHAIRMASEQKLIRNAVRPEDLVPVCLLNT